MDLLTVIFYFPPPVSEFRLRTVFTFPGEANPRLALPSYVDMEPWLH